MGKMTVGITQERSCDKWLRKTTMKPTEMEKKQSSVEWLANNLDKYIPVGNQIAVYALLEKAKAMHGEEIETAYKSERYPCSDWDAQEYYNQTFGNETK